MQRMLGTLLLALGVSSAFAQNPPDLFTQVEDASQPSPPRTFAAFPVGINFSALDADPANISIQLPGVGTVTANRTRLQARAGGYDWIGKTPTHDVVLSVDGSLITGFIRGGVDTFSILSGKSGQSLHYSLQHMDSGAFPADLVIDAPAAKGALPSQPERICFGKDFEPIDLLVVYSPEALTAAGGDVGIMENNFFNAVASANVTLGNSNVPTYFNLVRVQQAPLSLVEEGDSDDVANARNNAELIALRRLWKADVVTYVTSVGINPQTNAQYCGVTRTMRRAGTFGYGYDFAPSAVNVVTWACGVQNNDLSHEAGHNAGLDHNPGFTLATPAQNLYPFAYGHHVDGLFRDDMSGTSVNACPGGCPRQMFFSDATQDYLGIPRGVPDQRDNAQVYRRMFRCVNTFADYVFADGLE